MATIRIYTPSSAEGDASGDSTLTGLSWNSSWTAAAPGGVVKHRYGYADIPGIETMPPGWAAGGAPTTAESSLTFSTGSFASSASRYGMRIYLGPLKPGATITGGATLTGAMQCRTGTFTNTVYLTQSLQIRNYDTDTLSKTIEAVGTDWRDATVWNTSTTTRWDQATAVAGDYDIQEGDWLLWELGVFNDFLDAESRIFIPCSGQASDITSTDSTSTRNPFVEITYTGTLAIDTGANPLLMLMGVGT